MSRARRRALWSGAALAVMVGCIELGAPDDAVVSISNLRIPYPSVVIGDLLRDSLGNPAPVSIGVFGANGEALTTELVSFFALDSTLSVDADGTVHGLLRDSIGGRIVGGAGGLQTPPNRIIVTYPAQLATKSDASTSIQFDVLLPDSTAQANRSPALVLTLTGPGGVAAQGYIVSYQLVRSPAPKVAGTPTVYISDDNARATSRDTTDTQGVASRRVVLRQAAVEDAVRAGTKTDSIIVRATVKYLGADVPGSPVEFTVPVSRKP